MTVFVVWYTNVRGNESLIGIFSTREKAQKCINSYTYWDKLSLSINEETVE